MSCPRPSTIISPTTHKLLLSVYLKELIQTKKTRNQLRNPQNPNPKMPTLKLLITSLSVSLLFIHTSVSVSILDLDNVLKTSEVDDMVRRACAKKLEDCLGEQEMESESNRRVLLMQRRYISYETLRRDMVPCSKPGASYYDCNAGVANPYNRGCEIITRCARGIKDIKT
ncbi:hypothetical protein DITRI_Ditri17bG0033300 [Diplodiscus trichospermus]